MAKNAEDRYQSALGLKHDLEICLHQLKDTGRIENFVIGQGDICDRFVIPEKLYGREKEVKHLEQYYPNLLTPLQNQHLTQNQYKLNTLSHQNVLSTNTSTSISKLLDLSTVMKAAQALYSEINLDKLLSILMQVVVENAGADKATLFLNHQGVLELAVKYFDNAIQSLENKHVDKYHHVPVAVIHYVEHTLETVITDSKTHPSIVADGCLLLTDC